MKFILYITGAAVMTAVGVTVAVCVATGVFR
jgi:hypothetical protein